MNTQTQKYIFHIHGMHCKACELLTEEELKNMPQVSRATANLKKQSVEVEGDFGDKNPEDIAKELNAPLQAHGYTISFEKKPFDKKWSEFRIAIPIALGFAILFVVLQKVGLIDIIGSGSVTYGTAFVVGIVASLSTCMAVVGGLVLSMSATFAKEGDTVRPQLLFHSGRVVSFFVLGGVIGAIGSAFTLSTTGTVILGVLIGIVMLIMGINLLDVFVWAKRFVPSMPRSIARRAHGASKLTHTWTPLFVGVATFFLPCGFTQSMQLYTLSTGGFLKGGLTMLSFALGTLPVLALVSFSSLSISKGAKAGIFFKTAGLIVIMFALFNILNSMVIMGILPPLFNF